MAIDQLSTSNTFTQWLTATSSLIAVANSITDNAGGGLIANSSIFIQGSGSSLNVRTLANINTLQANTANIANTNFSDSNVRIQLDLTVGRNLSSISVYANEIYQKGVNVSALAQRIEPAFTHANSGFIQANSAFIHSNSGFIQANAAFDHANSGFIQANATFIHANSGFIQTNSAFGHANASFANANGAFAKANAAFANANGAFAKSNAAYNHANSGFIHANSGFIHANSGFIKTNSAFGHANSGFIQANSAFLHANFSFTHANSAFIRANNSLDANNGGTVTGSLSVIASGGIKVENASTQDSITIKGRPGGTSSYTATITPTTLTDNRVVNLPNESFTVGFRNIPPVGEKTSQYTLALSDVGKFVKIGTGGSIVIPDSIFTEGDAITIFNNTDTDVTLTCSITSAYVAAYNIIKSSITLSTRGVATIMFTGSTSCVVIGNVV